MPRSIRTPAAMCAYLVLASTAAIGTVAVDGSTQAAAASREAGDHARIPAARTAPDRTPAPAAAVPAGTAAKTAAKTAAEPERKTYGNDLDGWVAEARDELAANGDKVPSADAIKARAMTESSGNPRAENHWDGNQSLYGGTYGLIQTVKPTFEHWTLPGHDDILDPVDSIIAGVRYANDRYGSFEHIAYTKHGY